MHFILDRRSTKGNSSENRQKFLRRVRNIVRDSMQESFNKKSIKDISKEGQDILIDPKKIGKSLEEPNFNYDFGGDEKWVLPGNDQFSTGDQIDKPPKGEGRPKSKKSGEGENSEDPFLIHITQEEFLNFFFEDLELPDLLKKDLKNVDDYRIKNAGYSTSGAPSRLSVVRSMKQSLMRRMALQSPIRKELNQQKQLLNTADSKHLPFIQKEIRILEKRIENVPYLDEIDLRYRNPQKENFPSTAATMICIMDNSGSMGEREKTLSRKFFFLLYLFLNKKYKKVELIFLHHTTEAREVTEEEFFSMRESGGTIVSSALKLTSEIIKERNLSKTNLYICQCSDGDNMSRQDNRKCIEYLNKDILPATQYYSYIQIQPEHDNRALNNTDEDSLWTAYDEGLSKKHFSQQLIFENRDIYKVFRKLFEKKTKTKA